MVENPGHDQWRRRLERLNAGLPPEHAGPPPDDGATGTSGAHDKAPHHRANAPGRSLGVVRGRAVPRTGRRYGSAVVSAVFGAVRTVLLVSLVVCGLLAAFPLVRERKGDACSSLEHLLARQVHGWVPRADAPGPSLVVMPDTTLPGWLRCYMVYWRRLDVMRVDGDALRRRIGSMDASVGVYFVVGGLLLSAFAFLVWRRRSGFGGRREDAFSLLGTDAKTAVARAAAPPVDLSKPILGEAVWKAVRAHATDAAYLRAVETVRLRYQLAGNPMLLPNTVREVMGRSGLTFREAMLRIADDDGIGGRR